MFLAKVIGNVVATQKSPEFQGMKLLLLQPYINRENELVASGSFPRVTCAGLHFARELAEESAAGPPAR